MGGGQASEAVAYSFAGQALVATLTQLSQATNAVVACVVFGEAFTIRPKRCDRWFLLGWDLGAVGIILSGVSLVAFTAPPLPCDLVATDTSAPTLKIFKDYFDEEAFLIFITVNVLFSIVIAGSGR